ncbi:flagellar assembly protein FliW [Limnochorda pilosa]|uniref:Flagellar assembly factor FliW n=1 Tax=Limnochorda pilosa TaxID=1555112 RepID=A0A0K2SNW8_LIMPI|nr:flagellar assembly protein FliW [Limnochorda pilosa]BAS28796.1 flagellar assembly protein FliW [Limnochorda pilosa]
MEIETTQFGRIDVREEDVITFPSGMIGFEEVRRYALLDHQPGSVFRFLQAVEEPGLAFILVDPRPFFPEYRLSLRREELAELEPNESGEIEVYGVVTLPGAVEKATVNLKAPVLIHRGRRLGMQWVLEEEDYPTRQLLFDGRWAAVRAG